MDIDQTSVEVPGRGSFAVILWALYMMWVGRKHRYYISRITLKPKEPKI